MPLEGIRKIVDADIPIRRYPDITHSLSSQYPIPKWDLAWAITLGRECINPRPVDEKLMAGENIFGTCITVDAPRWPEIVAGAGLDFVFLDTEHIPLDRAGLSSMCRHYMAHGLSPIVRIPGPDPNRPLKGEKLKAYMNGAEQMPEPLRTYLDRVNFGNLCIANIESTPAVENLDELLSIDGLDAVFIGPHDLSISMGIPEQYDHPEFIKTVRMIIQKSRTYTLGVGIHFSLEPQRQIDRMKEGANIVIRSSDMALFSQRLKRDMMLIRSEESDENITKPSEGSTTI